MFFYKELAMPGFDKTGPQGEGPLTGRGDGPCLSDSQKSIIEKLFGRGRGLGRALGRGLGRGRGQGLGRGLRNRGGR